MVSRSTEGSATSWSDGRLAGADDLSKELNRGDEGCTYPVALRAAMYGGSYFDLEPPPA